MNISKSITQATIKALQPGDIIRDPVLKGFGARYRTKTITYFVQTRIHNRQRWFSIGTHASPWTPEDARKRARAILHGAAQGLDITAINHGAGSRTFQDVLRLYLDDRAHHLKASTLAESTRLANAVLVPFFNNKPFGSVTRDDILQLRRALAKTPGTANHALILVKAIFNWAEAENLPCPAKNPCARVQKYKRPNRARFLSIEDLERLSHALRTALATGLASPTQISAILLLLFTGARRGEVFTLKRCYVDKHRMLAHLPDSKTGPKVLHLNAHAMAILAAIPEVQDNPYYLPGRVAGSCISDIKKPWHKIRKLAQLDGFRLHDFRHSFASFAADTGATSKAVGDLLGHASIETTKLYVHLFNNRARQATEATGEAMFAVVSRASGPSQSRPNGSANALASSQSLNEEAFIPAHCG